jgi:hypothetical protein
MTNLPDFCGVGRLLRISLPEMLLQAHRQNLPGESGDRWSNPGAQLSFLTRAVDGQACFAVLDSKGESIVALDAIAKKCGVKIAMRTRHALSLAPQLSVCRIDSTRLDRAQKQVILALLAAGIDAFARPAAVDSTGLAWSFFVPVPRAPGAVERLVFGLECLNLGPVLSSQTRAPVALRWCSVSLAGPQQIATSVQKKDHLAALVLLGAQAALLFGDGACEWRVEPEDGSRVRLHARHPRDIQPLVDCLDSSGIGGEQKLKISLIFEQNRQMAGRQPAARSPLQDSIKMLQNALGADRVVGLDCAAKSFVPLADDFASAPPNMRADRPVFSSKMRAAPASIGTILLARSPRVGDPWPLVGSHRHPKSPALSIASLESHPNGLRWLQSTTDVFALFREQPSGVWQLVGVMD